MRFQITLQIYCLNPAVALVDVRDKLHSLVVASGTLSPMKSFQCELDIPFPFSLSLNHVVSEEQMLACVVAKGPKGWVSSLAKSIMPSGCLFILQLRTSYTKLKTKAN